MFNLFVRVTESYDIIGDDVFHLTALLLPFGPAATFGPGGLGTFIASTGILTVILHSSVSVTDGSCSELGLAQPQLPDDEPHLLVQLVILES
jgi:hypothetical protein